MQPMPHTTRALHTVLSPTQAGCVTSLATRRCALLNHHHVAIALSEKSGRVLASATNSATPTGSVHAEVAVLQQLHRRLRDRVFGPKELARGVIVLSLRITPAGVLRLAKPCAACAHRLRAAAHVRRVAWSNDDGELVCERCEQRPARATLG